MNFAYNFAGAGAVVADSITTTGAVVAGTTVTAGTGITATTGAIAATAGAVTAGTTVNAGTGVNLTAGQFLGPAGTAGAPTYSYTGDPNTGVFNVGGDQVGTSAGAQSQLTVALGSTTFASAAVLGAATYFSGAISPTALAANTDNYAPTGYTTTGTINLSASAPVDLTGIAAIANLSLRLFNNSANTITLKHDVTSTAANRFYCPGAVDFALTQYKSVLAVYNAATSRWILDGAG